MICQGMAYIDSWGNLRYVANQAFMALLYNRAYKADRSRRALVYSCFARKQLRYMLGESGQSYVVGVGSSPVCRPHHRAASCGPLGSRCDCSALRNPGCNPNTLYGALVGGPGPKDDFNDARNNYQQNEVALDWNAGFSGVLAGLASGSVSSWEDCKSGGLTSGRGSTSGAGGAAARGAKGWAAPLLAAAAAAAAGGLLVS
jgi:hypothetical protein